MSKGSSKRQDRTATRTEAPSRAHGSLPVWGTETWTPPVSDPFAPGHRISAPATDAVDSRAADEHERGCLQMKRFVRFASALTALAAIFLVAGAGSKY